MSVTAVPIRPLKKGSVMKLWAGLGALALGAAGLAWAGTSTQVTMGDPAGFMASNARREGVTTTASGLQYQVIKPGTGIVPGPQDLVLVEYEGRLLDGTVFDSTKEGSPVPLPVSGVIPGWTEALMLMKKGAEYRLWIPPELGYGAAGAGGVIPANAVLDFDVTLVDVAPGAAAQMGGMPPGL
ncbi:MAG TPA: FKBP-type peptidyl-prolyl cis-trans isomerase [Allosphingosinicella sp.]|nr:FKBP-type peptidyl-prolyl cis-trans isomerase [Allosphingosinicella sp.]